MPIVHSLKLFYFPFSISLLIQLTIRYGFHTKADEKYVWTKNEQNENKQKVIETIYLFTGGSFNEQINSKWKFYWNCTFVENNRTSNEIFLHRVYYIVWIVQRHWIQHTPLTVS